MQTNFAGNRYIIGKNNLEFMSFFELYFEMITNEPRLVFLYYFRTGNRSCMSQSTVMRHGEITFQPSAISGARFPICSLNNRVLAKYGSPGHDNAISEKDAIFKNNFQLDILKINCNVKK